MTVAEEILPRLAESWFGSGLPREARRRLATIAELRHVEPGAVLLREGTPAGVLGIVVRGRVGLELLVPQRGAVTVMTVEAGDVFGWSVLVPPHRSTSTAVARTPTEVIVFPGPELRALLEGDDLLAVSVYPRMLEVVARRLSATRYQLLDLYAAPEVQPW